MNINNRDYILYAMNRHKIPINLMGVLTPIMFNESHPAKSPCTLLKIDILDINKSNTGMNKSG